MVSMSTASDLADKAKAAFVDDDFQLAVEFYDEAINVDSECADLYADRAQAKIKLSNFLEAVVDANKAIELDSRLAKAYLRKGTACMKLEEYQTAKEALVVGASLAQNDARFTKLIKECDEHIGGENGVPDGPSKPLENGTHASNGPESSPVSLDKEQGSDSVQKTVESEKPKYRHSFYQKPEEVVVTIFAKGVLTENLVIDFGEQILSVTIDMPGESAYRFQPRLFGKIVPDKCRYDVLKTKIEIRLAKAEPVNWASLEYTQQLTAVQQLNKPSAGMSARPSYPSSKRKETDWDKLVAQVKKEEKEEELDGDAAVNKMFGEIYNNSDEDMRRAMTKSFVESNGTVLSTSWKEVGEKKIEPTPPDSMELKKWEY